RRNVWDAADCFGDDSGNITFFLEDIFQVSSALKRALAATSEGTGGRIWRRYVLGAGEKRADILAEDGFAPNRDGIQGCAVKGVPHRNVFVAARGGPRQFQGHADSGSPSGSEKDLLKAARGKLGQFPREANSRYVGVTAGAKRELVELGLDSGD